MEHRNPSRFPPPFPFHQMLELHHHHHHQQQQQQELSQRDVSEEEDSSSKEVDHPHHHHPHHRHHLHPSQASPLHIHHSPPSLGPPRGSPTPPSSAHIKSPPGSSSSPGPGSGGGGTAATGEVVAPARKPRGRPPGSKNKPKPPIIITRDTGTGMRPHVLDIAPNTDIVDAIATFARRRQRAVCVLSAKGTLATLTLARHHHHASSSSSPPPSPPHSGAPGATVSYHGRFDLISLSGAFLQPVSGSNSGPSMGLAVSVAGGPNAQVIGGNVAGPLVAASPVVVIAASFAGPVHERLPLDDSEEQNEESSRMEASPQGGSGQQQSQSHQQQQGNSSGSPPPAIPIHQLMNDPFGLAAAHHHHHQQQQQHHHHQQGMAPQQMPPPDLLASWAAAAAAGANRPQM